MNLFTNSTLVTLANTQAGEYTAEKTTELTSDLNPDNLSEPAFAYNPDPSKQTKSAPSPNPQSLLDSFLPLTSHPPFPANKS